MGRILDWLGLSESDEARDFRPIAAIFFGVVAIGLLLIVGRSYLTGDFATYAMWAMACSVGGAAIGFLFGIPKILQSDSLRDGNGATAPSYRQQINTNLTEISDWLTKIIVGLSLINLKRIPEYVDGAAGLLVSSVGSANQAGARGFATAVISSFAVIGFLFGYLSTRMFLAGAFSRADQRAMRVAETESQVAAQGLEIGLLKRKLFPGPELEGAVKGEHLLPVAEAPDQEDSLRQLGAMAARYLAIPRELPYGTKVAMKDAAANEMADFILQNRIPRDIVAEVADREHNEGLAIALATVANSFPERGDVQRLLRVGAWVLRLHVQYRIATAFGTLSRNGFLGDDDRRSVTALLTGYRENADPPLKRAIDSTLAAIAQPTGERIQRQRA